jgi:phosphatidylserine decarboxylase
MSARPVEDVNDPYRLVSGADCRLMAFETIYEATQLWIKGREFTVGRLLGDVYKREADRYLGGALAIFRLAPQDYHRFHSPVDGTIGPMAYISGEYYTVNVGRPLLVGNLYNTMSIAASHSNFSRRIWGERAKDCTHRQSSIWPCHGSVRWRYDGRKYSDYCQGR